MCLITQDKEGRLPLHWCTNNKDSKCIELLLEKVISGEEKIPPKLHVTRIIITNFSLCCLIHTNFLVACAGTRSEHQCSRWGHDDSFDVGSLSWKTEPHQGAPGKGGRPCH